MKPPLLKRMLPILSWTFAIFWIGFAGISMVYVIAAGRSPSGPELFGYRFMTVLSDSMTPTITSGDLVIGKAPALDSIQPGQIVTYRNHLARRLVTHRVVAVTKVGSESAFITQGDGNSLPDERPILARDVVAAYAFHLPFAGYLLAFSQTWVGLVLLVLIPSLLLMGSELRNMIRLLKAENSPAQPE